MDALIILTLMLTAFGLMMLQAALDARRMN